MLLDTVGNATAYYALKQARTAYAGPLVRLCKAGDTTGVALGFTASGALDETTKDAYLLGAQGIIKTWYDQSGNGHDLTQATEALMPLLVSHQGEWVIKFSGGDFLRDSSWIGALTDSTFGILWRSPVTQPAGFAGPGYSMDFSTTEFFTAQHTVLAGPTYYDGDSFVDPEFAYTNGGWRFHGFTDDSGVMTLWENGVQGSTATAVTSPSYGRLTLGKQEGGNGDVMIAACGAWNSVKDMSTVFPEVRTSYATLFPLIPRLYLVLGDSITTTYYTGGTENSWPSVAFTGSGISDYFVVCKGGWREQDLIDRIDRIRAYLTMNPAASTHLVNFTGTNDFHTDGISADALYAKTVDLIHAVDATTNTQILMLPRYEDGSAANLVHEPKRLAYNALLRSSAHVTHYVDVETIGIGVDGEQDSDTYYGAPTTDFTHLNEAGSLQLGNLVTTTLDTINAEAFMSVTTYPEKTGIATGSGTASDTITDGSTSAISSNAVFDALALKQNIYTPTINMDRVNFQGSDFDTATTGGLTALSNAGGGSGQSVADATTGINTTENCVGVINCTTGTGTTARAALTSNSFTLLKPGSNTLKVGWRCALSALSDGTNTYTAQIGFLDNGNGAGNPTDGAIFRYTDGVNSGKWQCVTLDGANGETAADSGVAPVATVFDIFEIEINQAGTSIAFYINGTLVHTATADMPTSGDGFGIGIKIEKSAGATSRSLSTDWYYLLATRSTAR